MAELENILSRMERINSDIHAAIRRTDKDRMKDLLALRGEFTNELGKLVRELNSDPRLLARRPLADEFSTRLFDVRQKLALHQATWRSLSIDENHADYLAATDSVHSAIREYVRWGQDALVRA